MTLLIKLQSRYDSAWLPAIIENGANANDVTFHPIKYAVGKSSGETPIRTKEHGMSACIKLERIDLRQQRVEKVGTQTR